MRHSELTAASNPIIKYFFLIQVGVDPRTEVPTPFVAVASRAVAGLRVEAGQETLVAVQRLCAGKPLQEGFSRAWQFIPHETGVRGS